MSGRARPPRQRRAELSQHFLRDASAARLVRATSLSRSDLVIEIGAGRGALTRPLTKVAGKVIAVELDRNLVAKLRGDLTGNLEVVAADFLKFDPPAQPYYVVGNIPFARTTDIIRKLSGEAHPPEDAWLVVQRELAHRMCGLPYGRENLWSLRLKPSWHLEVVGRLKRAEFDPPPAMNSVFLHMKHRGRTIIQPREMPEYLELIEGAFGRNAPLVQALRPQLSKLQLRRLAADLAFNTDDMPSDLMFEQWLGIFRFYRTTNAQQQ